MSIFINQIVYYCSASVLSREKACKNLCRQCQQIQSTIGLCPTIWHKSRYTMVMMMYMEKWDGNLAVMHILEPLIKMFSAFAQSQWRKFFLITPVIFIIKTLYDLNIQHHHHHQQICAKLLRKCGLFKTESPPLLRNANLINCQK